MSHRGADTTAGAKLSSEVGPVTTGAKVPADETVLSRYDALLGKLTRAERELQTEDGAVRSESLLEASSIVFDLLYALDFRRGGEMVPRLAALYAYMGNELLNVARTGDKQELAHLKDMITTLRQSWQDGEVAA